MTRLDTMRALLALPEVDGYHRQRGVKTPLAARPDVLRLSNPRVEAQQVKSMPRTRMAFVHGVHLGKRGA
jgi:hypothetical protein